MTGTVTWIRAAGFLPVVPYAYGASVPPDARFILLAGACPLDPEGRTTAIGDVAGQATACVATMAAALAAAGAGLADVVLSGGVAGTERQAS